MIFSTNSPFRSFKPLQKPSFVRKANNLSVNSGNKSLRSIENIKKDIPQQRRYIPIIIKQIS
jgi:hypothetical protein